MILLTSPRDMWRDVRWLIQQDQARDLDETRLSAAGRSCQQLKSLLQKWKRPMSGMVMRFGRMSNIWQDASYGRVNAE